MAATITLANFRIQFPEFDNLEDVHVQAFLTASVAVIDGDLNAAIYTQLIYYHAADSIASSAWGFRARLSEPGKETAYMGKFKEYGRTRTARKGMVVYGSGTTP